jgi:hypothetical protein
MSYFGSIVVNPATVWVLVAVLTLWAAWSAVSAFRRVVNVTGRLAQARAEIKKAADPLQFAREFESISDALSNIPLIGPRWLGFRVTLVIPTAPERPIRATADAERWFDSSLCADAGLSQRYHAALPNFLVGAGLLFTFFGLTVALSMASGVVAEGISQTQRNAALQGLLDAASFKFITSIAGLLLSISYGLFWRQVCLRRIDRALSEFLVDLEARIPLRTTTAAQEEANVLAERQLTQLDAFSNNLAVSIGSALDNALDQRLGDHIGPLTRAMEQLAAGMATQNQDAIGQMLDAFLQKLHGGADGRAQEVAERLATLGESLQGLRVGLQDTATRMAESAELMAKRMGEGAEEALSRITSQMGGLVDSLRQVTEQTRTVGADAGRDMATRIEQAASGFEAAARQVAETLATGSQDLQRRMNDEAAVGAARQSAQVEEMVTQLRALAESSRQSGDQASADLAGRIGAAASAFEISAGRVADALAQSATSTGTALGRGAEDAVQRIATATEGMRSELQAMLTDFRATLGATGEALRQGGADGAAAFTTSLGGAGLDLAHAASGAASILREAGEAASAALQRGGESAGGRLDQAAGDLGTRATALAREVAAATEAAATLPTRIAELQRAITEVAPPLTGSAADLRAAGEAARASVQPLLDVSRATTEAIAQINGAAQRLQGSEAVMQQLAEAVTEAAKRFDGVDRELARVVEQLQNGLQGFTRQVSLFVANTDKNLAQAATHLQAAITQLEDALDDHRAPAAVTAQRR